jgi:CheY-like chemotaxis protein
MSDRDAVGMLAETILAVGGRTRMTAPTPTLPHKWGREIPSPHSDPPPTSAEREYLRRQGKYADAVRPHLILLDLNLPRKDGREVLAEIKSDHDLRRIPVVVLTTSEAEVDILKAYDLHANCYISKPVEIDEFLTVVKAIEDFWVTIVKVPARGD